MTRLFTGSFFFVLLFTACKLSFAQTVQETVDTLETISITGSLDTYFHKSFGTAEDAPRTSFANLPGFSLGMVNLIAAYSGKNSGFLVDLVFGPRGSDAVFNSPLHTNAKGGGSAQMINQLFAYYQLTKNVKLNLGQFNTFLSYELISPTKNFHYSTSYLFSYGPFNHTGLWADIDLSHGWTSKLAIMNPTDYTEFNPFDSYTLGGQIGLTKKNLSAYLNVTYGDPDGHLNSTDSIGSTSAGMVLQVDWVASWNIASRYSTGIGCSYRTNEAGEIKTAFSTENSSLKKYGFYGVVFYQKLLLTKSLSFGLRTEYFAEFNHGVGAIGAYDNHGKASAIECTLSANVTSGNFRFIPEIRIDKTSTESFTDYTSGIPAARMNTLNLAVVYTFPTLAYHFKSEKN